LHPSWKRDDNLRKTCSSPSRAWTVSGKSTQIINLVRALHASGYRTKASSLSGTMSSSAAATVKGFVHKAYKSERGIGVRRENRSRDETRTCAAGISHWPGNLLYFARRSESAVRGGSGAGLPAQT